MAQRYNLDGWARAGGANTVVDIIFAYSNTSEGN
jgi:hypothetical protein